MSEHTPKKPNRPLSGEEVETALDATLRDQALLFPRTTDDVANIEAEVDLENVPTPDSNKFRNFLRNRATKIVRLEKRTPGLESEIAENLAMAARNGGDIPEDVRKQMDADRKKAEKSKRTPPDATR